MLPRGPVAGSVIAAAFLALWIGYALVMVAAPRLIWRFRYGWRATATPPPLYFWTTRLWGALCASAGIGVILLAHGWL